MSFLNILIEFSVRKQRFSDADTPCILYYWNTSPDSGACTPTGE